MAYRDKSGKITIDDAAARKDIKRLRDAADKVQDSIKAIESMTCNTSEFQGQTYNAMVEKNAEMLKRLKNLKEDLLNAAGYIENTLKRYKAIDDELKQSIAQTVITGAGIGIGLTNPVTGAAVAGQLIKEGIDQIKK